MKSGELQIKKNLMSHAAKLTTKMQLMTLFLVQIHIASLKFVPTVNLAQQQFHMNNS